MNIYGLEISTDEIQMVWDRLSNRINRDKNAVCLGLDLLNMQIKNWYEDINTTFSAWIARNMAVESSEIENIVQRAQTGIKPAGVEKSIAFLNYIIQRSNSGDLGRLRDNLDMSKVNEITRNLRDFSDTAMNFKRNWMQQVLNKTNIDAQDAINWENNLNILRSNINESISSIQFAIGCQQVLNRDVLGALRNSNT